MEIAFCSNIRKTINNCILNKRLTNTIFIFYLYLPYQTVLIFSYFIFSFKQDYEFDMLMNINY